MTIGYGLSVFLSATTVRGYREILTGKKTKIPKHSKILTDSDKEEMRLRKANNRAYCNLVLTCQGDIDFDLVDESGAAFHALFSGIRSSAALGLKGSPFYLKSLDICHALNGVVDINDETAAPFCDYFTFDDLAKALEDDFLDANRGSTDNRQGWKVGGYKY